MSQIEECSKKNEIESQDLTEAKNKDYWVNKFSGDLVRSTFHYDYKETVSNVRIIDSVDFRFSGEIFSNLMSGCNGLDIKFYEILTAGLVTLLSRNTFSQSGLKDITVGSPVLFQQRKGVEAKPINTILALRYQFDENIKFKELVTKVGMIIKDAQTHKDFPVEDLPDILKMKVFGDDFPLFDVAISLENIQDRRYIRHLNVNMMFSFFRTDKYLDGVVEYNSSLYERYSIKKIIAHYTNLMRMVLADTEGKVGVADIDILTEEEKQQLLYDFSGGAVSYPRDKTAQDLFEAQVNKVPDKKALVIEHSQMSYGELNRRSNRIAWLLRHKGVKADSVVPMMVERSIDAIVAIMGIIKSGAGYLPIVVDNPKDRIQGILNDSDAKIIVTREKYEGLVEGNAAMIHIEDKSLYEGNSTNPPVVNNPESLMYVIYTSGSTGRPKGVMLDQDNFINLMFFQFHETNIDFSGRILQFASIGFDVSAQEIFSTLLFGGTLHLTSDELKHDAPRLFKYIQKNYVEILFMPPAFLKFAFSDSGIADKFPTTVKHIIAAGEQLIVTEGFEKYLKKHGVFLHNHYGPTESHVITTLSMDPRGEIPEAPSIGKPITNNNVLVLGRETHIMQPLGIPGELYLTGVNVARGYSNRPELTQERFMMNPYLKGERMYRTGDLSRWLPDGNIDYLGRIDFQVKIRGFRIEIGEIESQLLKYEEKKIKEAVVLAREESKGAEKYLCAYIVSDEKVDTNKLSYSLSKNLPDYMIPSYFVQVEKIPLTSNGKVDRRALPDPKTLGRQERYVAPRNEIEKSLVEIWADVLHVDKDSISIDDNFFKLGGHSLKAALMIATIHKILNVKMSIYDIFEMPTIMELAHHIGGTAEEEYTSIELTEEKEYYLQTSAQKRLYFIDQLEKSNILYNIQLMDIYCKGVNIDSLQEAFKELIKRHESLRTSFHTIEGEAIQRIHDYSLIESDFNIEYYETTEEGMIYITESTSGDGKGVPFMQVVEGFVRPFNLGKAPLIRVGLIKIWGNTQILMMDMHHIISDGISLEVLLADLWALYDGGELPELNIQYRDFSEWLNSEKQKGLIRQQEDYWLQEFSGEIPVLNLPADYHRPAKMTFDGDSIYFEIGKEETKKLYALGQEHSATLYMVILALYNVLLAKISGQEEIIVGTVSAGRNHADLHNLIGMFVETLAIRNNPRGEKNFTEFVGEVKKKTLSAFTNQNYPFEQLVSKVSTRQDKSRNPLFDVVFSYENEAERSDEYLLDVLMLDKSNPFNFKIKKAKFDLTLIGAETGEEIQFTIEYNTQLFKLETIERLVIYFKKIISTICSNPLQLISKIDIMPDLERGILLYAFNDTEYEYPKDKTINELFEEQAEKNPDNVAVFGRTFCVSPGSCEELLTYRELNKKAKQLAWLLRTKGMKADHIASIMVESSQEMIIGLMGILKAGGAFLPIKDGTPKERTEYILQESGTHFLLTREILMKDIEFKGTVIELDNSGIYTDLQENLPNINGSHDLAYVIYTSGSTGKPKGVMINHQTLVNLCYWHNDYYSVTSKDHATKYAGFGFDASVWEVFPYLLIGAAIFIVPEDIKLDIHSLNGYFQENKITISFLPTQLCEQFMTIENTSLRVLVTGGDKLKTFVKKNYQLYNNYGPTENTVVATSYPVTNFSINIPIGKPLYNNQIYVMDKENNLQPIGVPGELCIGGDSLARGYLNNPGLTREKFIDSPFKHLTPWAAYPRLYCTGDLVRWLPDGNVEFLGRIDYQVKIRGFRIELGEIENQLLHQDQVKEAVVIARDDPMGQKYLCAYIVPAESLDTSAIKQELAKKLPDYMVPTFLISIESIPLTPNGKIDTKALPEPEVKAVEYIPPTSEIEEILVNTWMEVLGIEKIGIDDNYFEIGGDSIKTILISSKLLKKQLSAEVNHFFQYPTIRQLALQIKKIDRVIDQGIVSGEVGLTPIQMWFFENHLSYCNHFNQSILLSRKQGFDERTVSSIFTKILEFHDALRMVYRFEGDIVRQINRDIEEPLFDLEVILLKKNKKEVIESEIKHEANRIQRGFDLKKGPLVKLGLFKGFKGDYLLIVIHHLVIDGVSWRILLEDFETAYQQAQEGKPIQIENKTDSFRSWAQKLMAYASSNKMLKELSYWEMIENTPVKPLPCDYEIGEEPRKFQYHHMIPMALSKENTAQLLTKVNWAYNTEINDILLTALGLAINRWAGTDKVMINLEGHGREKIIEDININRTVGWFTTQYPVILDMKHSHNLSFSVMNVKETLRRVPNKGIGYGILKYLTPLKKKENIQFKRTPEIVFNYLGQFGDESYTIIEQASEISDPRTGDSISPDYVDNFKIDIEGAVVNGILNLYFFYHTNEYTRETIERLAGEVKSSLAYIISHCVSQQERRYTPSDLGYGKLNLEELDRLHRDIKANIAEDMEIQLMYPLSPMQSGMLYHSIKDKDSNAYFEQNVIRLYGDIDQSILESSLNQLIDRYDILRTIFLYSQLAEPLQIVLRQRAVRLDFCEDISHLNDQQQEIYLEEFRQKDQKRGFEVTRDMLIRFSLFKIGVNKHIMVLSFHHILMDGWCLGIILAELRQIYLSLLKGESLGLEPVNPYVSYIRWLEKQDRDEGLDYWERYLESYDEGAILPKFGQFVKEGEYNHEEYLYQIDMKLLFQLNKLASANQVTLNTLFQTIWGLLLQMYNNTNDVVFGAIVSGRPSDIEGVEHMVGLFINMIPVRIKSREDQNFSNILKQVQMDALEARKHEYLPVAEIQSKTALKGDLINHIMIYENYPVQEELEKTSVGQGFIVEGMKIYEHTNYDFNVIVIPWQGLDIIFSYNALVYELDIITNIAVHLEKILRQVVDNPFICIRDLHLISEDEKKRLLFTFNDSELSYPKDNKIHELYEIQVEKAPDAIVAVFKDRQLSYRESCERTNQVAELLRQKGIEPDSLVCIMVNRSLEMLLALLGVLRAGGAYVPIDPEYPVDRVEYMIKDSNATFLLTQQEVMKEFEEVEIEAEVIDIYDKNLYSFGRGAKKLDHSVTPHHLAYVIYTSGSTGKPKGVTIRHRNAVNFIKGMTDRIDFSPGKTILAVTTLCFDIFFLETLLPVTIGLKLAIADEGQQRDPGGLWEVIAINGVSLVQLTPSRLKLLLSHSDISYLEKLEYILVGGEAFPQNLFIELKEKYPGRIIDVYGPTETTVWSTSRDLTDLKEINIGTPISNTQIYILNKHLKFQPVGVIGELYIGGDGVSRGYLNRPELTNERFIENPFAEIEKWDKPYKKIYNTGDIARWLPDGNIDFLGRVDHQVKIRGFRIETGEIETQILKRADVKESVVISRDDAAGEKFLCAYIVPESDATMPGKELSVSELRDYLLKELPDYMVPPYFVLIEKIPLTPNGKVDRKSLITEGEFLQTGIKYTPPRNDVEEQLIRLWQEVLNVKQIGIHDNFFELGGNSLKAIQLVSLMVKNFDIKISHIFQYRTVAELGANVLFNKDNIKQKLEEMKNELNPAPEEIERHTYLQPLLAEEKKAYIKRIEQEKFGDLKASLEYRSILLTGVTGYLGAHLVPELLQSTAATLYFLVRGVTHEDAEERLRNKLSFYFGEDFFKIYSNRFKIINGDLRKDNFGLEENLYDKLTMETDAVIHAAANVRHIGQYEEFYEDNVRSTERMLEYSVAGKKKDFHFISTMGVCSGKIDGKNYVLYNEYLPDAGQQHENVYARSKFEAEKLVMDYRKKSINTSIYRVGILVFHSETGKFQENIEDNAFYANLKAFLSLGIVPELNSPAEFSFIDYVAKAITLLLTREKLKNEVFHLTNHNLLDWTQMGTFLNDVGIDIQVVSQEKFFDYLLGNMEKDKSREEINRFLLNSGFFSSMETEHKNIISMVESSRTVKILKQVGFDWPKVNEHHIARMIAYGKEVGFF